MVCAVVAVLQLCFTSLSTPLKETELLGMEDEKSLQSQKKETSQHHMKVEQKRTSTQKENVLYGAS
jgi:Na+/phosphate symporter